MDKEKPKEKPTGLITVKEFADYHGVHPPAVYKRVITVIESPEHNENIASKGNIRVTLGENGKWMINMEENADIKFKKQNKRKPLTTDNQ